MKIAIVHGPNLNMLGKRDVNHYGMMTLDDINCHIQNTFPKVDFEFFQSNHEGAIIDFLQQTTCDAIVINAGAYTHTSIAIRDCLEIIKVIKVEVHLSNIYEREAFRRTNYIKDVVNQTFFGKKEQSYIDAVTYILEKMSNF